ncbi:MAG TPA: DUF5915 domain-containing protein, partial [Candidatus Dojkabacteria bacterium]|nr:DUF5915 domain-containing protein [Candidatus Dojkabacteria bacterium]
MKSVESVHLDDYPTVNEDEIDFKILEDMQRVRDIASNGLKVRENVRLNLRQPLAKAFVNIKDEELREIVREEINVKEIFFSEKAEKGEGMNTEGEGSDFVTIDCNLTDELKNEAFVNEFMRRYKDLRKKKGLKVDDMVTLHIKIEEKDIKYVIQKYVDENLTEFHAKSVEMDNVTTDEEIEVMGVRIGVGIS